MVRRAEAGGSGEPMTAGWQPVSRIPTYELVLDQIQQQLQSGRLRAGDRLPAERDLAEMLGVSRAGVREAVGVLRALGVVRTGTGSAADAGTVLDAAPGDALTKFVELHILLASVQPSEVVKARVALEKESALLAAAAADTVDPAPILAVLDAMDDPELSAADFNELDTAFHVALARASGNHLVAEMTVALRNAMRGIILARLEGSADVTANRTQLRGEHRAIFDAVLAGDGPAAAELLERHIMGFLHRTDLSRSAAPSVS